MSDIPLPPDARHQRFADLILAGRDQTDAYLEAGFQAARRTARANAARLRKSVPVTAYIQAMQAHAAEQSLLSVLEIRRFCARVVRTPITALSPDQETDADLIKTYSVNHSEVSTSTRLEKHDPFKAIEIDLKLSGQDPETNALRDLAAALSQLGESPLPSDKM
jgi:phage terminase small subunit